MIATFPEPHVRAGPLQARVGFFASAARDAGAVLYLHMGMPKTGTTLLQATLAANAPVLAERGFRYPDRWRTGNAHVRLNEIYRAPNQVDPISRQVCECLVESRGRSIILSSEGLAHSLLRESGRDALALFLDRCAQVAELRVVMALRRLDEFLASSYLQVTKMAQLGTPMAPEEYVRSRGRRWMEFFPGLRWLREETPASVTLLPYLEGVDSLPMLLESLGIDRNALRSAEEQRVNRRLGLKAQAALMLPDRALQRLGLERKQLIAMLQRGDFAFRDELYEYETLGPGLRREIHAQALSRARQTGIDEYVSAFADADVPATAQTRLDPSLVSDADFQDLADAAAAR